MPNWLQALWWELLKLKGWRRLCCVHRCDGRPKVGMSNHKTRLRTPTIKSKHVWNKTSRVEQPKRNASSLHLKKLDVTRNRNCHITTKHSMYRPLRVQLGTELIILFCRDAKKHEKLLTDGRHFLKAWVQIWSIDQRVWLLIWKLSAKQTWRIAPLHLLGMALQSSKKIGAS